jgi:hypothetical protein
VGGVFVFPVDNEVGGACCTYGGRAEVYTVFWWGALKERDHLESQVVDGRIILRWIFRKCYVRAWIGSIWLRMGIGHL